MRLQALYSNTVSLSISESPDMPVLGLAKEHLDDALAEVTRHLMATGNSIIYGGDLRKGGLTEVLFELVMRYQHDTINANTNPSVCNFLAWPVHISMDAEQVAQQVADLEGIAKISFLTLGGEVINYEERQKNVARIPTDTEWSTGLTSMRKATVRQCNAQIVIGGRVKDFKGIMPGIAEEVLIGFHEKRSVFLLGGFGGCARDIAEELGLVQSSAPPREWLGRDLFTNFAIDNLNNGLTEEENIVLATTEHIDKALPLILRGLLRQGEADVMATAVL